MEIRQRGIVNWKRVNEGEPLSSFGRPVQPPVPLPGTFEVERLIIRRYFNKFQGPEYLVKWQGYPAELSTWEPERHIPHHLRSSYGRTEIQEHERDCFFRDIERAFRINLRKRSLRFTVPCNLDVYRAVFQSDSLITLNKSVFDQTCLSADWRYIVDGEGTCVEFSLRVKPFVKLDTRYIIRDGRVQKISKHVEAAAFHFLTRACDANVIMAQ